VPLTPPLQHFICFPIIAQDEAIRYFSNGKLTLTIQDIFYIISAMKTEAKRKTIEPFIRQMAVFKNLSANYVYRLVDDFELLNFQCGDTVFYQSDNCNDLYVVISGTVKASLINDDGQELILSHFKEGDFFGEMSLLDGKARSATMIAVENSMMGRLKRERLLTAMMDDPRLAIDILAAIVQRLRSADEMIENIVFLDVGQRIVKTLLSIAKAEDVSCEKGYYRVKKIAHKELAAMIGASRESVSKSLKTLALKKSVIEKEGFLMVKKEMSDE
jgi:CRP/FNR family transcriptional regulator/CRP/FNR family cyclic AMP-dependent transcriptional regulator